MVRRAHRHAVGSIREDSMTRDRSIICGDCGGWFDAEALATHVCGEPDATAFQAALAAAREKPYRATKSRTKPGTTAIYRKAKK